MEGEMSQWYKHMSDNSEVQNWDLNGSACGVVAPCIYSTPKDEIEDQRIFDLPD